MDTQRKKYAEINGEIWQAVFPLCSGCSELIVGGSCNYEGNGCRFPEIRATKPRTMYTAFQALNSKSDISLEKLRKIEIEYFGK